MNVIDALTETKSSFERRGLPVPSVLDLAECLRSRLLWEVKGLDPFPAQELTDGTRMTILGMRITFDGKD